MGEDDRIDFRGPRSRLFEIAQGFASRGRHITGASVHQHPVHAGRNQNAWIGARDHIGGQVMRTEFPLEAFMGNIGKEQVMGPRFFDPLQRLVSGKI